MKLIINYFKIFLIFVRRILRLLSPAYYYCELGTIYFDINQFKKSLNYFLKSENLRLPENNNLSIYNWRYIGYSYMLLGDYLKAKDYFEKVFAYDKNDSYLVYSLAKCYDILGNIDDAGYYYNYAVEMDEESFWDPLEAAVMFISQDRPEETRKFINIAETRAKSKIETLLVKAWQLRLKNNFNDALEILSEAIILINLRENKVFQEQRANVITYYYNILSNSGNKDYSIKFLEEIYDKFPNEPLLNFILAKEYNKRNSKLDTALKMIEYALKKEPYNPSYNLLKNEILALMKRNRAKEYNEQD